MTSKADIHALVATTGRALASGKRLQILELLAQRERGVTELASLADLNVTTVSAHLQVLREAGLVTSNRDGTHVAYELSGDDVAQLLTSLTAVAERTRADVQIARAEYLSDGLSPVTREHLAARIDAGDVVVLDVRPADEFRTDHLPGAVSIPLDELAERIDEIPRELEVVAYCRGRYCMLSHEAARLLEAAGRTVHVLDIGVLEWRGARSIAAAS